MQAFSIRHTKLGTHLLRGLIVKMEEQKYNNAIKYWNNP